MDDLTKIVAGLVFAFTILILGAKAVDHWSKGNRKVDELFREEKPSNPVPWIMVGFFYLSLAATFIFKNMIFVWITGGFIAVAFVIGRIISVMRLLGIGPFKGHAELEQMEQELKELPERFKQD